MASMTTPTIKCEKCQTGAMAPVKVFRFSGCLVAVGVTVLVPAILGLVVGALLAIFGTVGTATTSSEALSRAKATAARSLREIPVEETVVDDFFDDAMIREDTLARLSPEKRRRVEAVMDGFHAQVAGAALGTTAAAGVGMGVVVLIYLFSIPAFVLGLVLILRKKVWRCSNCGYVFERA
jgi:hypothetical protein